jgi:hypothetical protein
MARLDGRARIGLVAAVVLLCAIAVLGSVQVMRGSAAAPVSP